MLIATFTEFRNNAKKYFDKVEKKGESVEIYRHGKPVAVLTPSQKRDNKKYWREVKPLVIPGVSASKIILEERERSRF